MPAAPKIIGAPAPLKGAEKQTISIAASPLPRMVTITWKHSDPTVTFNVYHSLIYRAPMVFLTNTPLKQIQFPANKKQEYFGIKATRGGLESDWGTR